MNKELNLCELLKGCEGISIYSPTFGKRIIREILPDRLRDSSFICYKNGKIWASGEVIIYPSRALYEKYPLDPYSAWQEWKEERKPKRWRADGTKIQTYWYIDAGGYIYPERECFNETNNRHYKYGNYFYTSQLATQASEAVKETLQKFHEK